MFDWVGRQFDAVLTGYVLEVVQKLSAGIAPVALGCVTLWFFFYGWAVLRGDVQESVPTLVWKAFKITFVLILALHAGVFVPMVSDNANALATGVATTFVSESADPMTITSPYALLDAFDERATGLVLEQMREAGITRLDLLFGAVVCAFANYLFLCVGLYVVSLSKVLLTFVIAVGPIFILALAWKPTARFFDSWLSMVLNAVVMTWFAFFALGLSVHMGQAMVKVVQENGGFLGPNFNVVSESLRYCVVMTLMAIVCFQAPSLAAALTGGSVVQQGVQMIQNSMVAAGMRSPPTSAAANDGGAIRRGTGPAYAAGRATGVAVRVATNASRQGVSKLQQIVERGWARRRENS